MGPSSHCHRKSCTAVSLALPHLLVLRSASSPRSLLRSPLSPLGFRFPRTAPRFLSASFCSLSFQSALSSSLRIRPLLPLQAPVFPHIENCTGSAILTRYLFPLPSVSVRFRFLLLLAFPDFRPYSLPSALCFCFSASPGFPSSSRLLSSAFPDQALDRLVSASSHVTMLSPLTYLPCRLQGVLLACAMAVFFLRWASRLDAFSVYPVRTSLPCYAVGTTTVAPVVRPSRSSRTRDSSSHDSCAHDG